MMIWIAAALSIFVLQIGIVLLLEFRNPSKTTAWLLIIFLFPVIGFVLYYFIAREYGQRKIVQRHGKRRIHRLPSNILKRVKIAMKARELKNKSIHTQERLFNLLQSIPESPITKCNRTEIYSNGEHTFDAILRALEKAEDHIHLEYYIIRADDIGHRIQQILIRKAAMGVTIRLIYDGMGCYDLSSTYIRELTSAGVEVHCFLPLRLSFFGKRMNYRNHRKIIVIDGKIGFLGGINIGDEYLGKDSRLGYWRDTHMLLEGDAVFFLQHTFLSDWAFVSHEEITDSRYFPEHGCIEDEQVQIIASGPDAHWDTILELYFSSISTAYNRVFIVTPYFIPDHSILMALKTAAVSGLDVRVIIPGIADHKIVKWASLSYIEELMHAGVKFYQYDKGFIHAKILIVDETIASVGTANLDMRSFFDNFELNAVLFDKKSIDSLAEDFHEDLANSTQILLSQFSQRSRFQRGKEVLARMLSPLL